MEREFAISKAYKNQTRWRSFSLPSDPPISRGQLTFSAVKFSDEIMYLHNSSGFQDISLSLSLTRTHAHTSVRAPYNTGTAPDTKSLTAVLPTIQVLCLARLVCVSNPEIKSLHFFEASVIVCQSTRCNIPEDSIVCIFSDHTPKENSTMPFSLGLKLDTFFGALFFRVVQE
jgi:hypothetical protein